MSKIRTFSEFTAISEWFNDHIFYHGTPNGDIRRSPHEIHVGTYEAAKEALNARIGVPAEGDWDGTREYGKTLLAGKNTLRKMGPYLETGFNCGDVPVDDYYPTERKERANYSDKTLVEFKDRPTILAVNIVGPMTNTPDNPHSDAIANGLIRRSIKSGKAKNGFYYINDGEDSGSISAVVPSYAHLKIVDKVNEVRQQLTIPFRERQFRGKTVHEHLLDALIDLQVKGEYFSKRSPDSAMEDLFDDVMLRVINEDETSSDTNAYIDNFVFILPPKDNPEMYSRKFLKASHEYDMEMPEDSSRFCEYAGDAATVREVFSRNGWKEFLRISRDKFDEDTYEMQDTVQRSYNEDPDGLIDCWRTVQYSKSDKKDIYLAIVNKFGGVGVYWAWDEKKAEAYMGRGGHEITLHGKVSVENVDWEETLYKSAYGLSEEHELRVKDNGAVKIVGFYDNVIKKYVELEEPMVVKAGR